MKRPQAMPSREFRVAPGLYLNMDFLLVEEGVVLIEHRAGSRGSMEFAPVPWPMIEEFIEMRLHHWRENEMAFRARLFEIFFLTPTNPRPQCSTR